MKVEGKVTDAEGNSTPAYISLNDITNKKRIYSGRPQKDGSYFLYVPEGAAYELAFDPEHSDITFFTKIFDLTTEKIPQIEKVNVVLKKPIAGDEIPLEQVKFKPYSAELEPASSDELKRLSRLAAANPSLKFEVQVLMKGYREDIQQTDPDLTEMVEETIDSVSTQVPSDSSLQQQVLQRVRYHNDRTTKQAQAIIDFLITQGIKPEQLSLLVNAIPSSDSTTQLNVRARVIE